MKTPATMIALALLTCACATQPDQIDYTDTGRFVPMDWPAATDEEFVPDPSRPITVDFTSRRLRSGFNPIPGLEPMPFGGSMHGPWDTGSRIMEVDPKLHGTYQSKDIHSAMHYIALQSGLQIIVQGDIDLQVRVPLTFPDGVDRKTRARDLIQSIAKANKLDIVEDGDVIILKQRPSDILTPSVTKPESSGRFNVDFVDHELIAALTETARVTGSQIFVPSERPDHIPESRITLQLKDATPDQIFRELARLGNLEIEEVRSEEDKFDFVGYRFRYGE